MKIDEYYGGRFAHVTTTAGTNIRRSTWAYLQSLDQMLEDGSLILLGDGRRSLVYENKPSES